ncbi:hypothetical protein SAMN05660649_00265 [Desulfotomaculum arcticum]|uniref:DUF4912 domain-containing protein n=1 Tax=Desulfotruncus arcticus DSM 17038 TaxID=1121424 RepID=A0A1I2N029_9FIRM|nr:DUF4912 domain-containing protein [Desulfotruncus arcticus]SFF97102.1 hypothetical protein SAMN05660649_00265 [Desulfotomaculum arcticum] [Desulfotruncus arcticus DSM 17038]
MSFIFNWALGVVLVLLLLTVFLWSAKNRRKPVQKKLQTPVFQEEFAEEAAFPVSQSETTPKISKHPIQEIPWNYGIDRLVLMVRDPNWIYAYWEITATKQEEFSCQFGAEAWSTSRPVLRVYDVTGLEYFNGYNANDYLDISINDFTDNWHIEVDRPNSSFCVDVGRVMPDGRFITILRSNIVKTPSVSISNLLDEEWMWIEGIYRSITKLHIGSSPMITEEIGQDMGIIPLGISSPGRPDKEV